MQCVASLPSSIDERCAAAGVTRPWSAIAVDKTGVDGCLMPDRHAAQDVCTQSIGRHIARIERAPQSACDMRMSLGVRHGMDRETILA